MTRPRDASRVCKLCGRPEPEHQVGAHELGTMPICPSSGGASEWLNPAIDLGLPYNAPGIYTGASDPVPQTQESVSDAWTTAGVRAWGSRHAANDAVARRILEVVTESGGECDTEAAGYIAENLPFLIRTHGSPDVAAIRREAIEECREIARCHFTVEGIAQKIEAEIAALAGDAPAGEPCGAASGTGELEA